MDQGVEREIKGLKEQFDSIAAIPSNLLAIESTLSFGTGNIPHLALVGPTGWGKTCLMEAAARTLRATGLTKKPLVINAVDWVEGKLQLNPDEPLLLDNFQDCIKQHKQRIKIQLGLERRIRARKATMVALTCGKNHNRFRNMLPHLNAWTVVQIQTPSTTEKKLLVGHMAANNGLLLSDTMKQVLASRLAGNGRTLDGALKRLRLVGPTWQTNLGTLQACGILTAFFEDNGSFDFKSLVAETAQRSARDVPEDELSIHIMRNVAQLHEADVAQYFEADPKKVYKVAKSYANRMRGDASLKEETEKCVAFIVDRLSVC